MKLKHLILLAVVAQGLASNAFAQNRGSSDAIFDEPAKAGGTQIFLGIAELILAGYAYPGLTSHQVAVNSAQLQLDVANDLPVSEAQRKASINSIVYNPTNYDFEMDVGRVRELKAQHARRLEKLETAALVSKAEKQTAIEAAEVGVAKSREAALKAAQSLGFVDKAVKVVRVGGSVLLVGDVVARIYVWNAMDANPTISPVATYLQHLMAE